MVANRLVRIAGIIGALGLPSLAVALDVPHVFKEGDVVSAAQMNANFQALAEAAAHKPLLVTSKQEGTMKVVPDDTAVNYSSIEITKPAGVSGQFVINASLSVATTYGGATRGIVAYIEESPNIYSQDIGYTAISAIPIEDRNFIQTINVQATTPIDAETTTKTYYLNVRDNGIGSDVWEVRWSRMSVLFVPD